MVVQRVLAPLPSFELATDGWNSRAEDFVEKVHGAGIDHGLSCARRQAAQALQQRRNGWMMGLLAFKLGFEGIEMGRDLLCMWLGRIMRPDMIDQIPYAVDRELCSAAGAFLVVRICRSHVERPFLCSWRSMQVAR